MSHRKIWVTISEIEDQQRADYDKTYEFIEKLAESGHMETDLRKFRDAALSERIDKLEAEKAEIRKGQVANRDAIAELRERMDMLFRRSSRQQKTLDWLGRQAEKLNRQEKDVVALAEWVGELDNAASAEMRTLGERKLWDAIWEIQQLAADRHRATVARSEDVGGRVASLEKQEEDRRQYNAQIHDSMWDTPVGGKLPEERDPDERPLPEEKQIQQLGDFIVGDIPGGFKIGDEVADTAIRLLKRYRAALEEVMNALGVEDYMDPINDAWRAARDALKGEGND